MAALGRLATTVKASRSPHVVLAGFTKRACASGAAVPLWSRQYSLQSEETSSQEDMPVEMENPYKELPPKCVLCGIRVDYKNVQLLSQFISPYTGRIFSRHITGLCEKKQWEIAKAIRRARWLGFMAVVYKDPAFRGDPKICNIKYPE